MSPDQNAGATDEGDEQPSADETQEHELGDEFTEDDHGVDEELDDEHLEDDEEPDDEEPDDEEPDDEDLEEGEEDDLDEDDEELEHVVSAETQEWDGLEAAEAEGEAEKTLASSAGDRVKHAGSSITSSFERVGHAAGPKITTGFKAVRRHVRFPMWLRFLTASLVIIASIAGATSASLILYLSDIANALKHGSILNGVQPFLKTPGSGPQTILILGSDKRNQQISGKYGLSDTTMLLRLDPDRNAIALLSLPRDLKVDIPGVGTDKLNAAYSLGGPKLTLQTVKQLTGLDSQPPGQRRLHRLRPGRQRDRLRLRRRRPPLLPQELALRPCFRGLRGDQPPARLPGALRVRRARLRALPPHRQRHRPRRPPAGVPARGPGQGAARAAVRGPQASWSRSSPHYTSSDINSAEQMLQVLRLFFDLRGAQIKEIHFKGTLGPSYVTATPGEIHTAVNQFLGIEGTPGPAGIEREAEQAGHPGAGAGRDEADAGRR